MWNSEQSEGGFQRKGMVLRNLSDSGENQTRIWQNTILQEFIVSDLIFFVTVLARLTARICFQNRTAFQIMSTTVT